MSKCYIKAERLSGILDRELLGDKVRVCVESGGVKHLFHIDKSSVINPPIKKGISRKWTNYDRIKSMSVEKFAKFLFTISNCETNLCNECPLECCGSAKGIEQWLESEFNPIIKGESND